MIQYFLEFFMNARKDIKIFQKKRKTKSINIHVKGIKIFLKKKKKSVLS